MYLQTMRCIYFGSLYAHVDALRKNPRLHALMCKLYVLGFNMRVYVCMCI